VYPLLPSLGSEGILVSFAMIHIYGDEYNYRRDSRNQEKGTAPIDSPYPAISILCFSLVIFATIYFINRSIMKLARDKMRDQI
jgi:hypothetical protein